MNSHNHNVLLQQDGAPFHTERNTIPAERKVAFVEPVMWPANSLDLILVDCAVWGALQQRVYCDDSLKLWNS